MNDGEFCSRINTYLLNQREVNNQLLDEAAKRTAWAFKRQLMENRTDSKGILRMSSGGQCCRKQWYSFKGEVGEPLSARTINTFLTGDIIEVQLSILGRLAGWQLMGKPDGEDEIKIELSKTHGNGEQPEPFIVKGHPDDILYVPEEKKYYLIEYKSASDFSYDKFESEGLDDQWGYFTQASTYAEALGLEDFILVMVNKNNGKMCDHVYKVNHDLVSRAKDKWNRIINIDEMPERDYDPIPETVYNRKTKERDETGRKILGLNCSYCQHRQKCFGDRLQVEIKGDKPVFVVS